LYKFQHSVCLVLACDISYVICNNELNLIVYNNTLEK
jgi:hypothetical protein